MVYGLKFLFNYLLLFIICALALPFALVFFRRADNTRLVGLVYNFIITRLYGIRVHIEGSEHLAVAKQPCIVIMNHQSSLDAIPVFALNIRRLVVMGKKELAWVPIIGWTYWLCGNIYVDRENARSGASSLDAGIEAIKKRNVSIMVFPEGTRSHKPDSLLNFKKGAFQMAARADVPILPVVVKSYLDFIDKKKRMFKRGTVFIRVLPPVRLSEEPEIGKDTRAATAHFHNLIQTEFRKISGIPEQD